MTLEFLPELIALILSFLDPEDLINCATVSKSWQLAVERCTFRTIHLKSTELDRFRDIFVFGHRRAALAVLNYYIILPTYSVHQCAKFETKKDKRLNNEALMEGLRRVFSLLHSWQGQELTAQDNTLPAFKETRSITFKLNAYSPIDVGWREDVYIQEQRYQSTSLGGRPDLLEHRYEHSYLRALEVAELPELLRVTSFHAVELCHDRRIEGSSLANIAEKLPNLEEIVWAVNDDEKRYPGIRRQHRHGK